MPVKSPVPATPKATTPKKRRTRKTNTTAKATPQAVKKTPVAKVTTTTFVGGKVKAVKSEFTRPSTSRLITRERYIKDIRTRWAIHQYEIQELGKDLRKGFEFVKPYHAQLVTLVKG